MIQTVDIPFKLPDLNEIIRLKSRMGRRGNNAWNNLKSKVEHKICFCLGQAKIKAVQRVDLFVYKWRCPNRSFNKSNIAAGGRKVFEDALVTYGALPNDGWKEIGDWDDRFEHPAPWGVTVEMHSEKLQNNLKFGDDHG